MRADILEIQKKLRRLSNSLCCVKDDLTDIELRNGMTTFLDGDGNFDPLHPLVGVTFPTSPEIGDTVVAFFDDNTVYYTYNGTWGVSGVVPMSIPTNPAGTNTQVQFNDGGVFGASDKLTFDKTNGTLTVQGAGTTSATSSVVAKDGSGNTRLEVKNNGVVEVGKQTDAATQNTAVIKSAGSDANIGLALMTKGYGAITAQVPDGTATGGNARGQYAVDLQMVRTKNTQVASGNYSTMAGGVANTASGNSSTVAGGYNNTASEYYSFIGGGARNTASGQYSFATNTENFATGIASSAFGRQAKAYMYGQHSIGVNVGINTFGHGQATMLPMAQNSTGTSDFFVKAGHNFAGGEGTGDNFKPDGTNRIIRATLQVAIVCNDKGDSGTLTTGDAYTSDITFAVQKVSNNISILGTVDEEKVKASAAMSSLVINVSADNATKEVKIQVTPPSGTGSTTKFRAVATLRCTEVAW